MKPTTVQRTEDWIAEDYWSYRKSSMTARKTCRIAVSRPFRSPADRHGDWACHLLIQGFTDGVKTIFGVGPIDALMNAVKLIQAFAADIGEFTPRALEQVTKQPDDLDKSSRRPKSKPARSSKAKPKTR